MLNGTKNIIMNNFKQKIGIVGLGYVGLPLAIEFGKFFDVAGYDIDKKRVYEINQKKDRNNEVKKKEFVNSKNLSVYDKISQLNNCNIIIITTPTPINKKNIPDLRMLKNSTTKVSSILKKNMIIVFESTPMQ